MKYRMVLLASVLLMSTLVQAQVEVQTKTESQTGMTSQQCQWQMWQSFKQNYIQNGRVIDTSDSRNITTSEGQSYGLFFALIANDRKAFEHILNWTESHLSGGDFTARLPAWLWGTLPSGEQGILDYNTASDSDLWIAYSLVEAGRLWNNYYYQTLGHSLAARILEEETTKVEKYGTVLLPGRVGFILDDNHVRLNPSYVPLQLLVRMQTLYPDYQWQSLVESSNKIILESMPKGFSPDWIEMTDLGIQIDNTTRGIGSYNAIRTYLWAGILPDGSPYKKALIDKMQPLVEVLKRTQAMPETFDTINGTYKGSAGIGLTASVIPLLESAGEQDLADQLASKTQADLPSIESGSYYQSVLMLFSQGWYNGRYQFDTTGKVIPNWAVSCQK